MLRKTIASSKIYFMLTQSLTENTKVQYKKKTIFPLHLESNYHLAAKNPKYDSIYSQ
jgi:hypothetical protein